MTFELKMADLLLLILISAPSNCVICSICSDRVITITTFNNICIAGTATGFGGIVNVENAEGGNANDTLRGTDLVRIPEKPTATPDSKFTVTSPLHADHDP